MVSFCLRCARSWLPRLILVGAVTLVLSCERDTAISSHDDPLWKEVKQLTLRQKVGQMTQINLPLLLQRTADDGIQEPLTFDSSKLALAFDSFMVGSVMNTANHALNLETWRMLTSRLHQVSKERVGVPIIFGIDAIHGANYTLSSTLLPHQLMVAATFNDSLAQLSAQITAYETKSSGIPWVFSPILDIVRNPLWVQFFETFGEDPYLAKRMGGAMVNGYQSKNTTNTQVLACAKHFIAVGDVRTGKDRTPIDIGERKLRNVFLPPFQEAVQSDVASIMIATNEIDGIPTHANPYLLKSLLREELGFEGVLISDWGDVQNLHHLHKVSASLEDAVKLAIESGIDMVMVPNDFHFSELLYKLVREGEIPESRLDESVYRILHMKRRIGLLDGSFSPGLDLYPKFGDSTHLEGAYRIATEGACLLKNEVQLLPLSGNERILICGSAADDLSIQNGAWSRTWQGRDTLIADEPHATLYRALLERAPHIQHADNKTIRGWENRKHLEVLAESDVVIVCVGERPATEKPGDVPTIHLPSSDQQLIQLLHSKGKRVVLVMIQNRPQIVREVEPLVDAVLIGFIPGNSGGVAIADLLLGKVSPSGKLPFSYPRFEAVYVPYSYKNIEALDTNYAMTAYNPQWTFGSGFGYSEISYERIELSHDSLSADDTLSIVISLKNQGDYIQKEAVLVFVADKVASVTPEVKRLVGYEKPSLKPGETKIVSIKLPMKELKQTGINPTTSIVETGWFDLQVGDQSASFFVTGG